jgi:hypothetical protein
MKPPIINVFLPKKGKGADFCIAGRNELVAD